MIDPSNRLSTESFLGVKRCLGALVYAMRFANRVEEFTSDEATSFWPQKLIKFFEQHLEWTMSTNDVDGGSVGPIETTNDMVEDPVEVLCESRFYIIHCSAFHMKLMQTVI